MSQTSKRQLRAAELVRHAVSAIFSRTSWRDERLAGRIITVTMVKMSPDLANAEVFIRPLQGTDMQDVARALNNNKSYVRRELAADLRQLRIVPQIRFTADDSFELAEKIQKMLRLTSDL
ncbi:MAG: 30S ribosome-binding factor RbfA [Alphaproteobacteria bacterium]|nr:30S ribosome-binding factor RbfA [Alphaproteobacteria bacterium]